jgi:serine/threonine-protein kinase
MGERAIASGAYILHGEFAAGGMASVHLARLVGPGGFSRTVVVKRLHPHLGTQPALSAMFLDEGRLAARIRHANVVPTLDVLAVPGEAFLVLEYVHGESLATLVRLARERDERVPLPVACAIMENVLAGLHAAHEARADDGAPLGLVHRDVSPHNVLVGVDGIARVLDFGVAKAQREHDESSHSGVKGKLAYMAPEQVALKAVDRRADVFCAGIVLWELLTGERLFGSPEPAATVLGIVSGRIPPPSEIVREVPSALDAVVMRALERDPERRTPTALAMRAELEDAMRAASTRVVGEWVEAVAHDALRERAARVTEVESGASAPVKRIEREAALGAPGEAPTEVSLAIPLAPLPAPVPRRARAAYWALGAIALAGTATALVAVRRSPRAAPVTAIAPPEAPSATAAASAKEPAPTPSDVAPPALATAPPRRTKAAHPPRAKSAQCSPNFYIDELGIKHLKPECL